LKALGLDVGGANLKSCLIEVKGEQLTVEVKSLYLPLWKVGKEKLEEELRRLSRGVRGIKLVGLTMTAELSDVYYCKREGVHHVIEAVEKAFKDPRIRVVGVKGSLLSPDEARERFMEVAAANWAATGWLAAKLLDTCVVVDVGSTTTSIIPVVEGEVVAKGLNDLEKLALGELVYTGALRTNVATVVDKVPLRGMMVRTSSELFATTGDVHLVLGHISEGDYSVDTADGRGRSREEALARLARVVCADHEMLSEEEIIDVAKYVYRKQLNMVAEALLQVYGRLIKEYGIKPPAATAGLGADFIAEPALREVGIRKVHRFKDLVGPASRMVPALGAGLMAIDEEIRLDLRGLKVSCHSPRGSN